MWGGFFIGNINFTVFSALGTAIFASTAQVHEVGADWRPFIVGLISLFIGGFLTGRMVGESRGPWSLPTAS